MNLYLIKQNFNNDYDTHDSAVVIASSEEEAKTIHPESFRWENGEWSAGFAAYGSDVSSWCVPEHVTASLIGTAATGKIGDIIISSFNAG